MERHERSELIPARNTYELFETTAALHGDRPALTILHTPEPDGPSTAYTHRSLLHELTRTANLYTALGVVAGDVVSILSRTHPEVPTAIWGAQIAGTASCINYLLAANVIAALLTSEDAKVLVCPGPDRDPEIWAKVEHLAQECACLETILVLGEIHENADPRCRSYGRLLEDQSGDELLRDTLPDSTEIAALFHTGGTTGIPKLVPQSHESQIHGAWSFAQVFDLCETDTCLNGFPFFHVGGTATMGLTLMAAGGHAVILTANGFRDRGVVLNIWKLVEYFGATVLGAVPTAIGAMTNVPLAGSDISTLRYMLSGGAAIPRAVADRFEAHTCVPILEQYGMTETNAAIATTPLHGWKVRGGSGLRCPFSRIRIMKPGPADALNDECEKGEVGLVTVTGPQVVKGYLAEQHTRSAFTPDGAIITGDLGYLDENGYLFITGRQKDLIIRSGHNIDPASIEEVANRHQSVALSAAVAMPDEYAGEIPVLYVSAIPGKSIDLEDLEAYLRSNIHEPPARPRHIFVLDEIPVTGVGKIYKPALRSLAIRNKLHMLVDDLNKPNDAIAIEVEEQGADKFALTIRSDNDNDLCDWQSILRQRCAELPVNIELRLS
ncbi:AMP-binding domain protein [Salinisphaera sp. C84B14]